MMKTPTLEIDSSYLGAFIVFIILFFVFLFTTGYFFIENRVLKSQQAKAGEKSAHELVSGADYNTARSN